MPVTDPQALIDNRVEAIRKYHADTGLERAELDVSGGLDSAVMLGLLALALGPENVTAVHTRIDTNPEQSDCAHEVAQVFGVRLIDFDLTDLYRTLVRGMQDATAGLGDPWSRQDLTERLRADRTILGSIRSCIRAPIGRGFNRMAGGGIRHGTGNECEDRWTRFYNKGGDGEVDTNPLAMLSKGEVFQLALALGVPKSIIAAPPSPDLWGPFATHNDEDEYADYFGFSAADHGQTFYSYIDTQTGEYRCVGLIERVSRLLDIDDLPYHRFANDFGHTFGDYLFEGRGFDTLVGWAVHSAPLRHVPSGLVGNVLLAARRIERMTRHKWNPNCPTLGSRADLVEAGIITNTLPNV